ncbi:flagellar hook-basal body protein [Sulfobacillus thermosulfidooxidans]|uniref:flagellar hook-basal body protein n=1 Tax=Sulfobacillus thermosulfidooxidans TaxID=28034 RepID=UPI0006B5DDA7|nr:flagellar hook basal-body protein [Sulfobacillus thermosulfidooxidans]
MFSVMSAGTSGLESQNLWLNAIATNIANNQTPGFGERVSVLASSSGEKLRSAFRSVGNQIIEPSLSLTSGAHLEENVPVFSNQVMATSNPHDVAIDGNGFFVVKTANGSLGYTRAGTLQIDSQGHLELPNGNVMYPPITIPAGSSWYVTPDGTVMAGLPGQAFKPVGQLQVALIPNPAGLISSGYNLYGLSVASGTPVLVKPGQNGAGLLQTSALNASGVNMASELTDLIQAQGAYQMNAKILAISQSLDKGLTQIIT